MDNPLVASIVVAVATSFSISAQADIVDVYFGGSSWQAAFSGEAQDGTTLISIQDDLGIDDDSSNFIYFGLEHPLPVLPNIRLQRTDIGFAASNEITAQIDFEGEIFTVGETVNSNADLTHTDVTLYWEVVDLIAELDLGITARIFDGVFELESDTVGSVQEDFDDPIPMLYARAGVNLPFTGLSLSLAAHGISFDDDVLYDATARVNYESKFGLGVEAGYRVLELEIDDEDVFADFSIDGVYAGLSYRF